MPSLRRSRLRKTFHFFRLVDKALRIEKQNLAFPPSPYLFSALRPLERRKGSLREARMYKGTIDSPWDRDSLAHLEAF